MNIPKLAALRISLTNGLRQQKETVVETAKKVTSKLAVQAQTVEAAALTGQQLALGAAKQAGAKLATRAKAVEEHIASHALEAATVGVATAALASSVIHGLEAPKPADFQNFTAPFTSCAPVQAPIHEVISGTLPDGRTFKAALNDAAGAKDSSDPTAIPCLVEQAADAEGKAELSFLQSPEAKSLSGDSRAAIEASIRRNRVSAAEADLQLVKAASDMGLREEGLQAEARAITTSERQESWDKVASQYASLLQATTPAFSKEAAQKRADEDLRIVRFGIDDPEKNPNFVAGGSSEADRQRAQVDAKLATDTPERTQAFTEGKAKLLGDTQKALARRATPLWSEDHPTESPPEATLKAVDAGVLAGKTLDAIGAPLDLAYRAQPGVAQKHLAEIKSSVIDPVFARELPRGQPTAEMTAKAVQMWSQGASPAAIDAALTPMIHATAAWRESIVAPHLGDYYAQNMNWDCGPSSAANVFDLLGITPANDDVAGMFINAFGATPDIGVPGGVDYMAPIMMDIAKNRYGVSLTGYLGEGRDFNALRQALNDGYVVMLNGTVVGTPDSGHFIAIKKINADGTLMMADPWAPEFANQTITFDQLAQFTNPTAHHPQFFAFARS